MNDRSQRSAYRDLFLRTSQSLDSAIALHAALLDFLAGSEATHLSIGRMHQAFAVDLQRCRVRARAVGREQAGASAAADRAPAGEPASSATR